jgi:hypothetical protein
MAATIDLFLNIQDGLSKVLEKNNKNIKNFNSKLEDSQKLFNKITTEAKILAGNVDKLSPSKINFTTNINEISKNIEMNPIDAKIKPILDEKNIEMNPIDAKIDLSKEAQQTTTNLAKDAKKITIAIDDTNDKITDMNKELSETETSMTELDKLTEQLDKGFDDIGEELEENNKKLKIFEKIGEGLKDVFGSLLAGIGFFSLTAIITDTVGAAFELDTQMRNLAFRMGMGVEGAQELKNATFDLSMELGIATDKAGELITKLVEFRVPRGELTQLAKDTAYFSEITGVTSDTATNLAGKLSLVGKLGQKSITNVLGSIVQVQRAFGLTTSEVEDLSESITETTQILGQLGRTKSEIEKFAKGTAKLVAAFRSVGVSAQEATKLIERMLDPAQVEDNSLLFAKLGVSIQDAMSGNIDVGNMAERMKSLGQQVKALGPIAGAQLAQQMGMSLNTLRQFATMDLSEIQEQLGGMGMSSEEMARKAEEQRSAQEDFQKAFERVKTTFVSLADSFIPIAKEITSFMSGKESKEFFQGVLEGIKGFKEFLQGVLEGIKNFGKLLPVIIMGGLVVFSFVFKKIRSKWHSVSKSMVDDVKESSKSIKQDLIDGVVEGTKMASQKANIIMQKNLVNKERVLKVDTDISEAQQSAAMFSNQLKEAGKSKIFGMSSNLVRVTQKWYENYAKTGSYADGLNNKQKIYNEEAQNTIRLRLEDQSRIIEIGNQAIEMNSRERKLLETRRQYLIEKGKTIDLSVAEKTELQKIQKRIEGVEGAEKNLNTEMEKALGNRLETEEKLYKKMTNQQIVINRLELEGKKAGIYASIDANQNQVNLLEERKALIENQRKFEIDEAAKVGKTISPMREAELNKELSDLQSNLNQKKQMEEQYNQEIIGIGERDEELINSRLTNREKRIMTQHQTELQNAQQIMAQSDALKIKALEEVAAKQKAGDELEKQRIAQEKIFNSAQKGTAEYDRTQQELIQINKAIDANKIDMDKAQEEIKQFTEEFNNAEKAAGEVNKKIEEIRKGAEMKVDISAGAKVEGGSRIGDVLKSGLGKLGGAVGKVGKGVLKAGAVIGGAIGGVMMLGRMLGNNEVVQKAMKDVMEKLKPVFEKVGNVVGDLVEGLMNSIGPAIEDLIKGFIPAMEAILPFIIQIAEGALPPLLRLLEFLIKTIGGAVKALGNLPFAEGLKEVGENMISAAEGMGLAAGKLEKSFEEEAKKRTELEEQKRQTRAVMSLAEETFKGVGITNLEAIKNEKGLFDKNKIMTEFTEEKRALLTGTIKNQIEETKKLTTEMMKTRGEKVGEEIASVVSEGFLGFGEKGRALLLTGFEKKTDDEKRELGKLFVKLGDDIRSGNEEITKLMGPEMFDIFNDFKAASNDLKKSLDNNRLTETQKQQKIEDFIKHWGTQFTGKPELMAKLQESGYKDLIAFFDNSMGSLEVYTDTIYDRLAKKGVDISRKQVEDFTTEIHAAAREQLARQTELGQSFAKNLENSTKIIEELKTASADEIAKMSKRLFGEVLSKEELEKSLINRQVEYQGELNKIMNAFTPQQVMQQIGKMSQEDIQGFLKKTVEELGSQEAYDILAAGFGMTVDELKSLDERLQNGQELSDSEMEKIMGNLADSWNKGFQDLQKNDDKNTDKLAGVMTKTIEYQAAQLVLTKNQQTGQIEVDEKLSKAAQQKIKYTEEMQPQTEENEEITGESFQYGGTVNKTGLAYVHKGETIIPANNASSNPSQTDGTSHQLLTDNTNAVKEGNEVLAAKIDDLNNSIKILASALLRTTGSGGGIGLSVLNK